MAAHATRRKVSSRLNHSRIWFQLANVRVTNLRSRLPTYAVEEEGTVLATATYQRRLCSPTFATVIYERTGSSVSSFSLQERPDAHPFSYLAAPKAASIAMAPPDSRHLVLRCWR
jgi:hypothetical protein